MANVDNTTSMQSSEQPGPSRPTLTAPSQFAFESESSPDQSVARKQPNTPCIYRLGDQVERGCDCLVSNMIAPAITALCLSTGIFRAQCDVSGKILYGYCGSWMRLKLGPLMTIDVSMNFANHPESQPKAEFEDNWIPMMQFWEKSLSKLVGFDFEFTRHSSRKLPSWCKRYKESRLKKDLMALYKSHPPSKSIFNGFGFTYNLFVYYHDLREREKINGTQLTDDDMAWLTFIRDRKLFDETLFTPDSDEEIVVMPV